MRHFYCRDVLWETFEQMANDFDCSIDYLVNEAMRYYARSKNYQSPGGPGDPRGGPGGPAVTGAQPIQQGPMSSGPTTSSPYAAPKANGMRGQPVTQPPPNPSSNGPGAAAARRPQPPTPGYSPSSAQRTAGASMGSAPAQPAHAPSMPPGGGGAPAAGAGPTLFLVYNGQRYPVTKDQFIIGRGSKTSDLPIKDGNISRKHAAVIRRNGTFYIKDLGSTNGIDYKGMRIDNKRIDEGDIFHLCDYELRFTYRADG
ncbi:MAG TPA: FHA domain-containing protein [Kofleriaceae bacterium]